MTKDIQSVRYYMIYPNGRMRLNAKTDNEAIDLFNKHWSAKKVSWDINNKKRCRRLIKETQEQIFFDPLWG